MNFIDGLKTKLNLALEKSRAVLVVTYLVKEIRSRLDGNGDGQIEVAEVLEALPTDILLKFGGATLASIIPPLVEIVKIIQGSFADKKV